MVGFVFACPESALAKSEIIPQLAYWNCRSGEHIDFLFLGYNSVPQPDFVTVPVPVPRGGGWYYSPKGFNNLRSEIERRTRWRYSGVCALLLTNAVSDNGNVTIDFSSAIVCDLERMKNDQTIPGVERFFESIFTFAENADGRDPTWGFSDAKGLEMGVSGKPESPILPETRHEVPNQFPRTSILQPVIRRSNVPQPKAEKWLTG